MIHIVNISDLPAITESGTGDNKISIGEYRDFNQHPELKNFLGNQKKLNIAWTYLPANQELPVHQHPMQSVIIVCKGHGRYIGEFEQDIESGDTVLVESGALHGFVAGNKGMLCLSIQNDGEAIYSNVNSDRVAFINSNTCGGFQQFMQPAQQFRDIVSNINEIIKTSPHMSEYFFGMLKRWSICFQNLIYIRQQKVSTPSLKEKFAEHFEEEVGHDQMLEKFTYEKDEVIEDICHWFEQTLEQSNDFEMAIILHPVLEYAGEIFSLTIEKTSCLQSREYVDLHHSLDEGHAAMCDAEIAEYLASNYSQAVQTFLASWTMFNKLFSRYLLLVQQKSSDKSIASAGLI